METFNRIAYFVSPHGFGHAARSCGVMAELTTLNPALQFDIFTLSPQWFFEMSLKGLSEGGKGSATMATNFSYHAHLTDIGLVQQTSLTENMTETVRHLNAFIPFDEAKVKTLAAQVNVLGCQLIICDIAPLGIAVAKAAGKPAVLIENFTWDWIYEGYLGLEPKMAPFVTYLSDIFGQADYHIQTEPICDPKQVDVQVPPISRRIRTPATVTRHQLGIDPDAKLVMITMGGVPWDYTFLAQLENQSDIVFLIPGASEQEERRGSLICLPPSSRFFHPDLINAADVVIGKVGYSTVAEIQQASVNFGYIARPSFRESAALIEYITQEMSALPIQEADFIDGSWLAQLPKLLSLPQREAQVDSGAEQAARFILNIAKN